MIWLKIKKKVKEIFKGKTNKIIAQAKAFLEKKVILINSISRLSSGIFLDIESYNDFHFLFGVLYNDRYIPFLSTKKKEEKIAVKNLLKFLKEKNLPVYHYYNYEPLQINKLIKKYKLRNPKLVFVDLYTIFSRNIAVPTISYSLKSLAKYFGFNWRTTLNGNNVVQKFEEFLRTKDKSILKEILKYNEDDVRATKLLLDVVNKISS